MDDVPVTHTSKVKNNLQFLKDSLKSKKKNSSSNKTRVQDVINIDVRKQISPGENGKANEGSEEVPTSARDKIRTKLSTLGAAVLKESDKMTFKTSYFDKVVAINEKCRLNCVNQMYESFVTMSKFSLPTAKMGEAKNQLGKTTDEDQRSEAIAQVMRVYERHIYDLRMEREAQSAMLKMLGGHSEDLQLLCNFVSIYDFSLFVYELQIKNTPSTSNQ